MWKQLKISNFFYLDTLAEKDDRLYKQILENRASKDINLSTQLKRHFINSILTSKTYHFIELIIKNYGFYFLNRSTESIKNFNNLKYDFETYLNDSLFFESNLKNETNSLISPLKSMQKSRIFNSTPISKNDSQSDSKISRLIKNGKFSSPMKNTFVSIEVDNLRNSGIGKSYNSNSFINLSNSKIDYLKSQSENIRNFTFEDFQVENNLDELVMVWDNSDQITVYDYSSQTLTKEIVKEIPGKIFYENNRFLNLRNKVIISGGVTKHIFSDTFLCLERKSNKIIQLSNMPLKVIRHSLILYNSQLYLVGGKGNFCCYQYNFDKDSWLSYNSFNYEREDSSLIICNDILYCFGGLVHDYLNFKKTIVESTYLNYRKKSKWTIHQISLSIESYSDYLQRISGSGVIVEKNTIYLCGGYNNKNFKENNFVLEFKIQDNNLIDEESESRIQIDKLSKINLSDTAWFAESNFSFFGDNCFCGFDVDGKLHKFSRNSKKFWLVK